MTETKLTRILERLRAVLERELASDAATAEVSFYLKDGGLAGDVTITRRIRA